MADEPTIYARAHLLAAATRLFVHKEGRQPAAEDLSAMLGVSLEMTLHVLHKMEEHGIVQFVPSAFKDAIYLLDHRRIEELAEEGEGPTLAQKFQEAQEARDEKVQEIAQRFSPKFEDERKKDLFAHLKDQLKVGGKTGKPNPLDEITKK
jgi:FtsZ-binding cell division protein ZapB